MDRIMKLSLIVLLLSSCYDKAEEDRKITASVSNCNRICRERVPESIFFNVEMTILVHKCTCIGLVK